MTARLLVAGLSLLAGMAFGAGPEFGGHEGLSVLLPGSPLEGRRLFAEKRCVSCHQVGPNLDFLKQFASPLFVAAALWNHGPQMMEAMKAGGIERPAFIGPELHDLLAYLVPASAGPREGPLYVLPGRAEEGRRLFTDKRCIGCHNVAGEGGRVGPDLVGRGVRRSLLEFSAAMWSKALCRRLLGRPVSECG